jgi:hypothetical protein
MYDARSRSATRPHGSRPAPSFGPRSPYGISGLSATGPRLPVRLVFVAAFFVVGMSDTSRLISPASRG